MSQPQDPLPAEDPSTGDQLASPEEEEFTEEQKAILARISAAAKSAKWALNRPAQASEEDHVALNALVTASVVAPFMSKRQQRRRLDSLRIAATALSNCLTASPEGYTLVHLALQSRKFIR